MKEAFSYATAEAMAKGIKPIINNWWGSETIWDEKFIYKDLAEASAMIIGGYNNPEQYRDYIKENYDIQRMFQQYDQLLGT
jgi:hypothetical protein